MRIIWQDEAERDLDRIAEYIMEDDPAAALRVVSTIRESARVLTEHPNIGRAGRVEGTRELVIAGQPYTCPIKSQGKRSEFLPLCTHRENGPTLSKQGCYPLLRQAKAQPYTRVLFRPPRIAQKRRSEQFCGLHLSSQ